MRPLIRNIIENEIVTSEEAAVLLDVSTSACRKMLERGKIEYVKKGTLRLIDIEDVKSKSSKFENRGRL